MHNEEFKSTLAKLRPVIGELADTFWLAALLDPSREKDIKAVTLAMAAELLEESYVKKHILLEPPPYEHSRGEYALGAVDYAGKSIQAFGLRESDFQQHIMIAGRSGAGKTNVGYLLVWKLLKNAKPFIILDWRDNYTHFLNRPIGKDILHLTLGGPEFSFNPLDPPPNLLGNDREAYIRDIVSTICTSYLPGNHLLSTRGVEYFLLRAIRFLSTYTSKPITSNDILNYMENYKASSREADWKASAVNVLFKLTTGPIGRLINSDGSVRLADILDKPVILSLKSLGSPADREAFSRFLLLWLYYYRLAEGKSQTFKHALFIEEAHNIFFRSRNSNSTQDFVLRQMRDLGESLILLDQNPSLISTPALGNTGTTICLNLKHSDDLEAAGKAMTLPRDEWKYIGRLPVGQAIVKLPGRWPTPFLVRFPLFPVKKGKKLSKAIIGHSPGSSLKKAVEEFCEVANEATDEPELQVALDLFFSSSQPERNMNNARIAIEKLVLDIRNTSLFQFMGTGKITGRRH